MNRRFGVIILSLMAVLAGAMPALSSTVIQFSPTSADQTWTEQHDGLYDGFYAGIYKGTITTGGKTVSASFVCDDFLNDINWGQSWYAYDNTNSPHVSSGPTGVRYLGAGAAPPSVTNYYITNGDLTAGPHSVKISTGYGQSAGITYNYDVPNDNGTGLSQQDEYNMIAWLVGKIYSDPDNSLHDWASEAGAIWSIADGGADNSSYTSLNGCNYKISGCETAQYWVIQAVLYHTGSSSAYPIYTPYMGPKCGKAGQPGCYGQEFWGPSPAPEPTVALLVGATLLGVGLLGKRVFGESGV